MNNHLKNRVMTRVYFEYARNIFFAYPDYFMAIMFMASFLVCISIHDVMINLPKDSFSNFFNFMITAIQNTHWFVQVLAVGGIVRMAFLGFKFINKNIHTINWIPIRLKY